MLNHTYVLLFLFDYQPEVLLFFTFSTGEITFSLPQLSIIGQCIGINGHSSRFSFAVEYFAV